MDAESTLLILFAIVTLLLLVALRSVELNYSKLSSFELSRRSEAGDEEALVEKYRNELLPDVITLRRILDVLLSVLFVAISVDALGFLGIVLSFLALIFVSTIASKSYIHNKIQTLYEKYEDHVIVMADKLHPVLKLVRQNTKQSTSDISVNSRDELLHLIKDSDQILDSTEQKLLLSAAAFSDKLVIDIMTPRSVVKTIEKTDVLGPIVLDSIHKTGYSRFPVIEGDLDHTVGLLYVRDLMTQALSTKKITAEKVMESKVFYINEQQTLGEALTGFLRVKHHLFIVVNEFEETTGIITLEDVIEALIGRKIMDEFDQYDDLRAVAKHAAHSRHKSANVTHITK